MATECFCLSVDETSDELNKLIRSLGDYVVEWRRKSGDINDNEDNELLINLVHMKLEADIDSYYKTRFYNKEIDMLDKITRSSWFG